MNECGTIEQRKTTTHFTAMTRIEERFQQRKHDLGAAKRERYITNTARPTPYDFSPLLLLARLQQF